MNNFYYEKLLEEEKEQMKELKNYDRELNIMLNFPKKDYKFKNVLTKKKHKENVKKISINFNV